MQNKNAFMGVTNLNDDKAYMPKQRYNKLSV